MKNIKVSLKDNSYKIISGSGVLRKLGARLKKLKIGSDAYIITNSYLKSKFGRILEKSLQDFGFTFCFKLVPDTEKSKSLSQTAKILSDITAYDQKKKIFIVAFGGGVIGDLAGFTASIYRRGTPYIQVPTTLLAQVDSSIGGKTAVDLEQGKNLAGTFYQPRLVLSDIDFLKSLPRRQLVSALAEVIKYAVIKDPGLFIYLEKNMGKIIAKDSGCLEFIVARCAAIKADIVSRDEKEELGLRTILNFGHTLGHAIEAAGSFKTYNHGEAIGLGMLCSCGISRKLGLLSPDDLKRIEVLIRRAGLPKRVKRVDFKKIINAHYHDKKFIGAKNKFVLASGIGRVMIKENIPLELIIEALRERF
ncbi:MAG: 3-dehydroquinate synthase [Candidatus Omnitrophica bacterium]|nr:3-dehydroquinate synthase [Candidatus Omnitrophota bacterium]